MITPVNVRMYLYIYIYVCICFCLLGVEGYLLGVQVIRIMVLGVYNAVSLFVETTLNIFCRPENTHEERNASGLQLLGYRYTLYVCPDRFGRAVV